MSQPPAVLYGCPDLAGPRVHHVEQWEVGGALSQGTLLAAPGRDKRAPVPRLRRMLVQPSCSGLELKSKTPVTSVLRLRQTLHLRDACGSASSS